jgi:hypothetical protein
LTDGFVSAANQTVIDSVTQFKLIRKNFQEDDLSDLFYLLNQILLDFNIQLKTLLT